MKFTAMSLLCNQFWWIFSQGIMGYGIIFCLNMNKRLKKIKSLMKYLMQCFSKNDQILNKMFSKHSVAIFIVSYLKFIKYIMYIM